MVAPPNVALLAGRSRGRGVDQGRRGVATTSKAKDLEQGPRREAEKREQVGVGVMISNVYFFPLEVGCLEVGGRSCRTVRYSSQSVALAGFCGWGGGLGR